MRRNESPDFVGLDYLKKKHAAQIAEFESWAANGDWILFHHSHYDWWTFPYGCHTSSYGAAYAIYEHEAELLKMDDQFIRLYLRGVELLMLSWGWDLYGRCHISNLLPTNVGRIGLSGSTSVQSLLSFSALKRNSNQSGNLRSP